MGASPSEVRVVYRLKPPRYSDAISRDSSWNITSQASVGGVIGGSFIVVSIKFRRTPRLQSRFDFLQFWQSGTPSSHFKCRSRQVKHPVRTRFGLAAATAAAAATSAGTVAAVDLAAIERCHGRNWLITMQLSPRKAILVAFARGAPGQCSGSIVTCYPALCSIQ